MCREGLFSSPPGAAVAFANTQTPCGTHYIYYIELIVTKVAWHYDEPSIW
jgi:hypothetical protein